MAHSRYHGLNPIQRFWTHVVKTETGCWGWLGEKNQKGYGRFFVNGKRISAHRFAYALLIGPILDDLWVLHRCDNPQCCNPRHLFLGTVGDNVRDCVAKGRYGNGNTKKTHCIRGHEYTSENTRLYQYEGKKGSYVTRFCRACETIHNRTYLREWKRKRRMAQA